MIEQACAKAVIRESLGKMRSAAETPEQIRAIEKMLQCLEDLPAKGEITSDKGIYSLILTGLSRAYFQNLQP